MSNDVLPDGTKIKAGNFVSYSPYAMGRLESLWGGDAFEFKPERWLKDGVFQPTSPFKLTAFQVTHSIQMLSNRSHHSSSWKKFLLKGCFSCNSSIFIKYILYSKPPLIHNRLAYIRKSLCPNGLTTKPSSFPMIDCV